MALVLCRQGWWMNAFRGFERVAPLAVMNAFRGFQGVAPLAVTQ